MSSTSTEPAASLPKATTTRVLVADDDAASCRFLGDCLRVLGAQVITFDNSTAALTAARAEVFDLLLLDCRMPGGGALHILQALHADPNAASTYAMAVASSAEPSPRDRETLLASGFTTTLDKPCSLADVRRVLELCGPLELDDTAALTVTGNATTMYALRGLLREELHQLQQELNTLAHDRHALAERLHRLRSSCGFCGATALARAVLTLQHQLAQGLQPLTAPLHHFDHALASAIEALEQARTE